MCHLPLVVDRLWKNAGVLPTTPRVASYQVRNTQTQTSKNRKKRRETYVATAIDISWSKLIYTYKLRVAFSVAWSFASLRVVLGLRNRPLGVVDLAKDYRSVPPPLWMIITVSRTILCRRRSCTAGFGVALLSPGVPKIMRQIIESYLI